MHPPLRIHNLLINMDDVQQSFRAPNPKPVITRRKYGKVNRNPVKPILNPRISLINFGPYIDKNIVPYNCPEEATSSAQNGIDVIILQIGGHGYL